MLISFRRADENNENGFLAGFRFSARFAEFLGHQKTIDYVNRTVHNSE